MARKAWFREQMQPEAPRPARICEISYEQILAFWREFLWPNQPESQRPMSTMLFHGGFDMSIPARYQALFLGLFAHGQLCGVVSGHPTSETEFRLRGLCVHPEHRGRGWGTLLLRAALEAASSSGASVAWSYPRDSAWFAYEKAGFRKIARKLRDGDQNCYAMAALGNE